MMSLISQNASTRKSKRTKNDEASLLRAREDSDDVEQYEIDDSTMKKKKKEQKVAMEEREMKVLESKFFGSSHPLLGFGNEEDAELDKSSALFYVDRDGAGPLNEVDYEEESETKIPVWVDEEEEETKINIARVNRLRKLRKEEDESLISGSEYVSRLRAQHVKLNPGTEWAQLDYGDRGSDDDDDEEEESGAVLARGYGAAVDDLLQTNEDMVMKSGSKLLPGLLECTRLVDVNAQEPSRSVINSVQFHRNAQLLLAAGLDKKLSFFQVDGKRNSKVQTVHLEDCPIQRACFLPDGSRAVVSGRRKFFYTFDLVKAAVDRVGPLVGREEKSLECFEVSPDSNTVAFAGNEGYLLLVSTKTKELVGTMKMNGTARALAFADENTLLSSGGDGHIYHWDLRTRACFHKGVDEGCVNGTFLAASPAGALLASGSDSGIVNVYNRDEFLGGKRKPAKTVGNLTTRVSFMKFSNDAQVLAICSSEKKNSLKLVHVPSFTVFSNWPPARTTLHYPRCLDFSPGGGFMAVGNGAGNVLLYKLHHYSHA